MGIPTGPAPVSTPHLPQWAADAALWIWSWVSSEKFLVGLFLPGVFFLLLYLRRYPSSSISIGLPFGLGSRTYDTTPRDRIVAWKLYVQLTTRKAALPFDDKYDLVVEIYDSLFDVFQITRELLIDLAPNEFEREEGVATLLLRVLNDG